LLPASIVAAGAMEATNPNDEAVTMDATSAMDVARPIETAASKIKPNSIYVNMVSKAFY